jgi:NodT family efflux transporter outer membrane factor (OMF) lipoprotein
MNDVTLASVFRHYAVRGGALLLGAALAGCVHLKPAPQPNLGDTTVPGAWKSEASSASVQDGWISGFGDPALPRLVGEALTNNPDLAATAARLGEAIASAKEARADLAPSLAAAANATKTSYLSHGGNADSFTFGPSLDLSWEADVWGRLRYTARSSAETAAARADDYVYGRRSLAAQVAKAWFAAVDGRVQVNLDRETVVSYEKTVELVQVRFSSGSIAEQDLASVRADLASARKALESDETAFKESVRSLELLLGRYPGAELQVLDTIQAVPPAVPAGLPSDLLSRRADVRAAQRSVAAAFNTTQAAVAARLPQFSLSAGLSTTSDEFKNLFDPKNAALTLAGNLSAPLYQGGKLKAAVALAKAQQREAEATYRSTVLTAFEEVENYLAADRSLAVQERDLSEALEQYNKALSIAEQRYTQGDIDLTDLLTIKRQQIAARSSLASLRASRLTQRVNLHLALGGNFES